MTSHDTMSPEIRQDPGLTTVISVVLNRPDEQRDLADSLTRHSIEVLARLPEFRSASIHLGHDQTRIVSFEQWSDATAAAQADRAFPLRGRALAVDTHLFDVVHTDDRGPDGVTRIQFDGSVMTFINVMHTIPDRQEKLLRFVVENDVSGFSLDQRYQSANFLRSRDGERVVNYSHWTDEQGLLDVVGSLTGQPAGDMAAANQLASEQAGPVGWTDFGFYDVLSVVPAGASVVPS